VTVNGRTYEVEVEEIGGVAQPKSSRRVSAARSTPSAGLTVSTDGRVAAPIPGKILSVDVKSGSEVKKGDTLLVVESMKIENPIFAPCDGRITDVHVKTGDHVRTGDPLVAIG